MSSVLYEISTWILPLVVAITFHEAAHGFVAHRLGDDTAYLLGRVTLNPLKHIDRFGTVILPGLLMLLRAPFLFGYAKPVPVNFSALRRPRRDMVLVAFAGPFTNILLALISAFSLHIEHWVSPEQAEWLFRNLYISIQINLVLAVFNMLPILPLDGGRVLHGFLPAPLAQLYGRSERYGVLAVLLLLFLPNLIAAQLGSDFSLAEYIIGKPVEFLYAHLLYMVGVGNI